MIGLIVADVDSLLHTWNGGFKRTMRRDTKPKDLIVYGLILVFCALQFAFCLRSVRVYDGDATNAELARSIIEKRPYGFNGKLETRFPPGFPLILAGISLVTGFNYGAMVRAIIIFTVLGFIASYQVLRREEGRLCAAIICLLLISSPHVFELGTQHLATELPYLLFSFLVLLTTSQIEVSEGTLSRTAFWVFSALALVASLMVRTAATALLGGLFLWLAVSFITEKKAALSRLKTFLPLLILGILVQALWMYRGKVLEVAEWPLNGYPGSYFSEVWLRMGNYPELGNASLSDFFLRLARNLIGYAVGLSSILSRKDYIVPLWFSPAVILPTLLITIGVAPRLLRGRGGLSEWYFICYMTMFLLWPWDYDVRFFLPVAPLACLYLWGGIKELFRLGFEKPRVVGVVGLPLCTLLGICSAIQGSKMRGSQPKLSALFWLTLAIFSVFILWHSQRQSTGSGHIYQWLHQEAPWTKRLGLQLVHWATLAVALPAVVIGFLMQVQIGRANLSFDSMRFADDRSAQYVELHTEKNAVIMAGHPDIVFYYCRRRVVWFPPITNAQVLMDGIRRYKVNYIIVIERYEEYWLPPEPVCFKALSDKYPEAFRLVYRDPHFSLYEVRNQSLGSGSHA